MNDNLTLMQRVRSKTPKWFRYVRNTGIILTAVSTAIISAGTAVPAILVTIAGYCAIGGTIAAAVAQTAVASE
jgi:hypothetical protein